MKKKNKKKITQECQDKSQESDIWEIPSDYSSHNSEQFTSDYGSTSKYITIQEEQEQSSPTKEEEQLINEEIKILQEEIKN